MSDPFVDPLDTSPVQRRSNPVFRSKTEPEPLEKNAFQNILNQTVQQQPTPVQIPKPVEQSLNVTSPSQVDKNKTLFNQSTPTQSAEPSLMDLNAAEGQAAAAPTEPVKQPEQPAPVKSASPQPSPATSLHELLRQREDTTAAQPAAESVETKTVDEAPDAQPVKDVEAEAPVEAHEIEDHDTPEPTDASYRIQRGDTLSDIIAERLRQMNVNFSTPDIYRLVNAVARQNNMSNPNRIIAGTTVDLTPVDSFEPVIARQSSRPTAMLEQAPISSGSLVNSVTSPFGMRMHPVLNEMRFHKGVDIRAAVGTPVHTVKPGVVSYSGTKSGYGEIVEVDHQDGTSTRYAHLSERFVKPGDPVNTDTPIALSGNTGRTTGPHLHFELRDNGRPVDPLQHLPTGTLEGVTAQISRDATYEPAT